MALSSNGSRHTYHLAPSVADVITRFRPSIPPPVASSRLRSRSSAFYHIGLPPSALSSPPFPLTTTFMQTTPNCSFSLYPANFDSSIIHLQNSLHQISSRMTANLLTLNSPKTEFLLKKQLDKIHNSITYLTPLTLLATSASYLTNILLFLTKFQPSPKLASVPARRD